MDLNARTSRGIRKGKHFLQPPYPPLVVGSEFEPSTTALVYRWHAPEYRPHAVKNLIVDAVPSYFHHTCVSNGN